MSIQSMMQMSPPAPSFIILPRVSLILICVSGGILLIFA